MKTYQGGGEKIDDAACTEHIVRINKELYDDFEAMCAEVNMTTQEGLHLALSIFTYALAEIAGNTDIIGNA